ncbi:hypothetical protein ANN_02123 [Periplaneta americana]|uniref:aspartate transaminase n=1 Tax=Periplaneta americana TaxID=6978 RepID=A0ABQ8TYV7_PERAM|nr:hypothetical protein ANN_02123 [Periplaneta americana]
MAGLCEGGNEPLGSLKAMRLSGYSSTEHHVKIFLAAGFEEACQYRYWNLNTRELAFREYLEDLSSAPRDSVIIMGMCAHNPTGYDPTHDQWTQIADVMEERQLFPFFDASLMGLSSGDIDADCWPVRYFAERGFELFCAQSFAKTFGLYDERPGNLTVVLSNEDAVIATKSQFAVIVREMYATPPSHGVRIVATVLNNPVLFEDWKDNVRSMAHRLTDCRHGLKARFVRLNTPGQWDHIAVGRGMYISTGLKRKYLISNFQGNS